MKRNRTPYALKRSKEMKKQLVAYKGGKCCICGYNKCIKALTFHHCIGEKNFSIADHINKRNNYDKIKVEVDKCILVCFNCHMEIHSNEEEQKQNAISQKN